MSVKSANGSVKGPCSELHRELVRLDEAAAAAYHVIVDRRTPLREPGALEEVRGLVAIALSTVAPVLREDDGHLVRLSDPEIFEKLYRPRGPNDALSSLYMRRVDLLRAVETIKEAHHALGRGDLLDVLRGS